MIDMRKFLYIKADPQNLLGYDLFVVRKCSCESAIVVGIPAGGAFYDYMPSGSYNTLKKITAGEVKDHSQMFFVPRVNIQKKYL